MWNVAFDARDAQAEPVRGWGRYARHLLEHLPPRVLAYSEPGHGPELLWEQVTFPLRARRDQVALLHAPNCFLPLRRHCPGVVTIHDLAFEAHPEDFSRKTGAKYRWVTRRAAQSAERIICDADFTADDLVARYGVSREKIRVIPLAPGLPIRSGPTPTPTPEGGTEAGGEPVAAGEPVPEGRPYLLAVGDLRPKKNLERLIAAHARLGTGHRLVLAGLGSPSQPLPAGVEATGWVDDAGLDALMRDADLLVHPSLYEGFGLVVAEAMTRGTPVACSASTALPQTAGGAAVLFDPLDVDAIAAGIREALERADELRAAGRERAREWSWAATAAATLAVYEELL